MESRGTEYFTINIECMLYNVYGHLHTYVSIIEFQLKTFGSVMVINKNNNARNRNMNGIAVIRHQLIY